MLINSRYQKNQVQKKKYGKRIKQRKVESNIQPHTNYFPPFTPLVDPYRRIYLLKCFDHMQQL